jgi:hypothetical protein
MNNPFYITFDKVPISLIQQKILNNKCLIFCFKEKYTHDNLDENTFKIFNETLTEEELKKISQMFILIKGKMSLLKIKEHYESATLVSKSFLQYFNHNNYILSDHELVIPMLELENNNAVIYKKMYNSSLSSKYLLDIYKMKNVYSSINFKEYLDILFNLEETKYWEDKHEINMTNEFINRRYPYSDILQRKELDRGEIKCSKDIINKLNNLPILDNYNITPVIQKESYSSFFNNIKTSKYQEKPFYILQQMGNIPSKKDIYDILTSESIALNEKNVLVLVIALLISKDLCHLIINNSYILKSISEILNKHKPILKYVMGYAWLSLYIEECIIKHNLTINHRCVFSHDTIYYLPSFSFSLDDIHQNPYLSIPISNLELNINQNYMGAIPSYHSDKYYGIENIKTIEKRILLFVNGNSKFNILDGMDWENYSLTGSVIPACCPKMPILYELTDGKDENTRWLNYFKNYYQKSDLDLMCNCKSIFTFMDNIIKLTKLLSKNIYENFNKICEINIIPIKNYFLIINSDYIKHNINNLKKQLNNKNLTVEHILEDINTPVIREYFYKIYTDIKFKINNSFRETFPESKNSLYQEYYKMCSPDELNIIISNNIPMGEYYDSEFYITNNDLLKNNDNKVILKLAENIKFKISSPNLHRNIEVFRIKGDFIAAVSRFHLPCVRAYFTYNKVVNNYEPKLYGLPSWVSAMMTNINIDYKYFAGIKNPIDIINKYRERGFGTILNQTELKHAILYNSKIPEYHTKYNLDLSNQEDIYNFLGPKNINHPIFKAPHCHNDYVLSDIISNIRDIEKFYDYKHNYNKQKSNIDIFKFKTIDSSGEITPLAKWAIIGYLS